MPRIKLKKKNNVKKNAHQNSPLFGICVLSLTLICALIFSGTFLGFKKIAVISSALMMPEGCIEYVKSDFSFTKEENTTKKTFNSEDAHYLPKAQKEESITRDDTYKSYDLKTTPQDILDLEKEFLKLHENDKKGGNIIEQTFTQKGSTNSFKNVFVKNITETKKLDIQKVLNEKVDMKIEDRKKPCVLIFHTHTTEGYEILDRKFYAKNTNGRTTLQDRNVVRVGDEIEKEIKKAGFGVIHDRTIHDKKYTGAYDKSRITVSKYLKENPSIAVVLDIHRDAIHTGNGDKIKPVTTIDGKKAAQVMIITGAEEGRVKDFPDWEYNLRFALKLQKTCADMYPTLMRPVLFSQRKYVMDLSHCNVLIEMGSDVNTLNEAAYSGRLIGTAIAKMMQDYVV